MNYNVPSCALLSLNLFTVSRKSSKQRNNNAANTFSLFLPACCGLPVLTDITVRPSQLLLQARPQPLAPVPPLSHSLLDVRILLWREAAFLHLAVAQTVPFALALLNGAVHLLGQ